MTDPDAPDLLSAKSLSRMPLFSRFNFGELAELRGAMELLRKPAGTVIVREGQTGSRDFFVVLGGSVEIQSEGRVLDQRGADTMFGEISFVADRPRTATVVAADDCVLLRVREDRVREMLTRNPMVAWKMMETIAALVCDRFSSLDHRVRHLMKDAPQDLQDAYSEARQDVLTLSSPAEKPPGPP